MFWIYVIISKHLLHIKVTYQGQMWNKKVNQ